MSELHTMLNSPVPGSVAHFRNRDLQDRGRSGKSATDPEVDATEALAKSPWRNTKARASGG